MTLFDVPAPRSSLVGEPAAGALAEGEARKRDGMARAEEHAPPRWLDAAYLAAVDVAELARIRGTTFTPDDVWAMLDARQIPAPHEPRALGPVMRRLCVGGLAVRTDRRIKSLRPENHRREIAVYEPTDAWNPPL